MNNEECPKPANKKSRLTGFPIILANFDPFVNEENEKRGVSLIKKPLQNKGFLENTR